MEASKWLIASQKLQILHTIFRHRLAESSQRIENETVQFCSVPFRFKKLFERKVFIYRKSRIPQAVWAIKNMLFILPIPYIIFYRISCKWPRKRLPILDSTISDRFQPGIIVSQRRSRSFARNAIGNYFCSVRFVSRVGIQR